jgi:hypothetical protein
VKPLIDDEERADSPDTVEASQEDGLEEMRKKFVGEVDLPESMFVVSLSIIPLTALQAKSLFSKSLNVVLSYSPSSIAR